MIRMFLIACLLTMLVRAYGQDGPSDLLKQYQKSKPDTARVKLLLKLSAYYLDKPLELKNDVDSALMLAKEAKLLSGHLLFKRGEEQADFRVAMAYVDRADYRVAISLLETLGDTARIRVMLRIAEQKITFERATRADGDTGIYYAYQALEQSRVIHSIRLEAEAVAWLARCIEDFETLRPLLVSSFASCRNAGYSQGISNLVLQVLNNPATDDLDYRQFKSIWIATLAGCKNDTEKNIMTASVKNVLEEITKEGGYNLNARPYTTSNKERFFLRILDLFGKVAEESPACYTNLCVVFYNKGDLTKSLYYGLKAEALADKSTVYVLPGIAYFFIGQIYFRRGDMDESITYLQKVLNASHKKGINPHGSVLKYLTRAYIAKKEPQKALSVLEEAMKYNVAHIADKKDILESFGILYQSMGKYDKAEQYYLECAEMAKGMNLAERLIVHLALTRLYVQTKQYENALSYLDELNREESRKLEPLFIQEEVALLGFRVDSARGNYQRAIVQLQHQKLLHDSIFNETKNKQLEELKIQYETDRKNKDIELLSQQNLLQAARLKEERLRFEYENEIKERELEQTAHESSRKDNELKLALSESEKKANEVKIKEQRIDLLKKEDEIKTSVLQTTTLLRNLFIGGAILLLLVLFVIYNRYRQNRKINRKLQTQQEVINDSNRQLQKLNDEQLRLLEEKDWLVKEIHHRVKNNLQIVMSLLNSQSAFIDNDVALTAINDSQNRVHAMSLIHQKLYNTENTSTLDMSVYIRELVSYLADSFKVEQRIRFVFEIELLEMDVSQAVPLGLILNEAITNAIKYAFPGNNTGIISVSLKSATSNQYLLTIADNGIGMPPDSVRKGSLGMSLMEGLSEDLDGDFSIENKNGTIIKVLFRLETRIQKDDIVATAFVSNN